MTTKRSGSKPRSGSGVKAGKRRPKKTSMRDLEPKDSQIRGGGARVTEEFPFLVTK
jgi:hypothetical protein